MNIGNPREMTIKQFAEEIIRITGTTSEIEYRPLPVDDPKVRQPDITRARNGAGLGAEGGLRRGNPEDDRLFPKPPGLKFLASSAIFFFPTPDQIIDKSTRFRRCESP